MREPRRLFQRFARARRGATAVEFALVSFPFLVLLFGIVELAMVFIVSTTLEAATESASRQIRTGEFQTSAGNTKADFKLLVCSKMSWLQANCSTDLSLDVRTFATFNDLANYPQLNPVTYNPLDPAANCWSPGEPTDIVLVRTRYQWKLFTPLLNNALQNMGAGSNKRMINSISAFRNEPFSSTLPVGSKCS
ncbi:TadE/TadG family type IV pilus assembly protein [Phenylobacterium sp.]|uniref:TadE/TadG family type IV pilus assembly protein n=1 Tax=Phenylobacterium sp. TaxID=1871053 RepID=UPI002734F46F|nr:TadE/TadG family type IV pilus assembly protein [Phenylobacterium sp.]MDP3660704.1 pilus assembly protein [Phenylobacterium sp.]